MAANEKTNGAMFPEWDFTKIWADMKMPEFNDRRDGRGAAEQYGNNQPRQ
jgi:hypothetical protein